jgi:hypothetical protein
MGSGGHFRSNNKPVTSIDGGVFLEPEMGLVILNRPVRFETPVKLKDVAFFVYLSLSAFADGDGFSGVGFRSETNPQYH